MDLLLIKNRHLSKEEIKQLCETWFDDMFKVVVDVKQGIVCAGGDLHADAEELLIENGSKQDDIWGANIYPFEKQGIRIEHSALINIKPRQNNPAIEIMDSKICDQVSQILLGIFSKETKI